MNIIYYIGSTLAAVFTTVSVLIGIGCVYGGMKSREGCYFAAALVMIGAGLNAGYHYTTVMSWIFATEIMIVSAFLLTLRHWSIKLASR